MVRRGIPMRLFFVDEHERASESLDRIELMSLDGDRHGRFVARWVARRIEERLSEGERQALREAAEPELRLWSLAGLWPSTRRRQPDLEPRGALVSRLVAEVGVEVGALTCLPDRPQAVAACADDHFQRPVPSQGIAT